MPNILRKTKKSSKVKQDQNFDTCFTFFERQCQTLFIHGIQGAKIFLTFLYFLRSYVLGHLTKVCYTRYQVPLLVVNGTPTKIQIMQRVVGAETTACLNMHV